MNRTRTLIAAISVAAFGLLAACSDSTSNTADGTSVTTAGTGSDSSDPSGTGAGNPDNTGPDSTDPTRTNPDGSVTGGTTLDGLPVNNSGPKGTGPGTGTNFCDQLDEMNKIESPTDYQKYFNDQIVPAIRGLQEAAPAELKDQMDLLAAAVDKFVAVFKANDWDQAKAFADPALQTIANTPEYNAAGDAVDTYCGY